ncbi:hypothetical protein HNP86_000853 [Methanococcus maripaludis]|uniref:Uncharacterized protein n=1 Tax=Methanococcus maripaludis TaxID=39152 RepID=A0A7J9P0V1_METMI|nr:hypothetical protein [Methanococcus maripaludis]MBA2840346.1 hypothetical protein [Methanococcus maripaludis]MBA2846764.1 hypothetical protein [Methanococcus maripaludis]MBA2850722.1 hypothetical protein [Methanococcus maripaludis]MBA2852953.1 hypothetical protein [Methanococcus maripaludis]MBA2858157.1 hypothetical protein [Methanococcus maripaludis]
MDLNYVINTVLGCYDTIFISLAVVGISVWSTFWFWVTTSES